jgi:hypothetical protein
VLDLLDQLTPKIQELTRKKCLTSPILLQMGILRQQSRVESISEVGHVRGGRLAKVSNFEQTEVLWLHRVPRKPLRIGVCAMHCALCESSNQAEFNTEVMIHLSGLKSIDRPGVLVFPKVLVCLDCGFSRFTTPETDLALLAERNTRTEASTQQRSVGAA